MPCRSPHEMKVTSSSRIFFFFSILIRWYIMIYVAIWRLSNHLPNYVSFKLLELVKLLTFNCFVWERNLSANYKDFDRASELASYLSNSKMWIDGTSILFREAVAHTRFCSSHFFDHLNRWSELNWWGYSYSLMASSPPCHNFSSW